MFSLNRKIINLINYVFFFLYIINLRNFYYRPNFYIKILLFIKYLIIILIKKKRRIMLIVQLIMLKSVEARELWKSGG